MGIGDKLKNLLGSYKGFEYLDELIHSGADRIVLEYDIVLSDEDPHRYSLGIMLDVDNLVIEGNGHVIDAGGKARIFNCTAKNVMLKNLTLKNGCADSSGGAIYADEGCELEIIGCLFEKNRISDVGSGGAISNTGGRLTIAESVFTESESWYGGAIKNNDYGDVTISSCKFKRNSAVQQGGAIFNRFYGNVNIFDSIFTQNRADRVGGAIFNIGNGTIEESSFSDNSTDDRGGAIYSGGELTVSGSDFCNNSAYFGGTIFTDSSDASVTVQKSIFMSNTAEKDAAVFGFMDGNFNVERCEFSNNNSPNSVILTKSYLNVFYSKFFENQSRQVIVSEENQSVLSLIDNEFKRNPVEESVIITEGKSATVRGGVFEGNLSFAGSNNIINRTDLTMINPKIMDGGRTILNEGYILKKKSPQSLLDKIYGDGEVEDGDVIPPYSWDFTKLDGMIHDGGTDQIVLEEDIRFEAYERDFYEGGIELDIDNLIIDGNGRTIDAGRMSRIFIITGKNITLKNITFKNGYTLENRYYNPLNANGGALRIIGGSEVLIENCIFINNVSEKSGGAIFNRAKLDISECDFSENSSDTFGSAITSTDKLAIANCRFNKNMKYPSIYNCGELSIVSSLFNENSGAVNNKNRLLIAESDFNRNDGWSAVSNSGNSKITQSSFNENYNPVSNSGVLSIFESRFNGNSSISDGGAIKNSGELIIEKSLFRNNSSEGGGFYSGGGAISNRNGALKVINSIFEGNIFENGRGGAINNIESELIISQSEFTNNSAKKSGGAIYVEKGSLSLESCIFEGNSSEEKGGAIYNDGKGSLSLESCSFEGNSSINGGGAIYTIRESSLTLESCSFESNSSKDIGGAIYNWMGSLSLESCIFEGNSSEENGGAIYNWNGSLSLESCSFEGNSSERHSGAIYLYESAKHDFENCTFKDNEPNDVYEEKN